MAGRLVVKQAEMTANKTELNHLGYLIQKMPDVGGKILNKLFAAENLGDGNYITSGLLGSVGRQVRDSLEWEWKLEGAETRPLMVTAQQETGAKIGKGGAPFKIVLEKPWFRYGDVLKPRGGDAVYQVRVQAGPENTGNGYAYTVVLVDKNKTFPEKYLKRGQYFSKLYSIYGESSDHAGSTQFGSWMTFQGRMTHIKKRYEVTDYASTTTLDIKLPLKDGSYTNKWVRYAEVKFFKQWAQEKENAIWLSRSTDTVTDSTGRPVTAGPGIHEQLEDGNILRANRYTYRMLEDYFMSIFFGRRKVGVGRDVKGFSGEYGIAELHRLGKDIMEKTGTVMNIETVTVKDKSTIHRNALAYGYQVTKLLMVNGISLELYQVGMYDNPDLFSAIDPITGKPANSMRMTFMDFSGDGVGKNVILQEKTGGFAFGYYEGLYGPLGPNTKGKVAHEGNWYAMIINDILGVQITDPTRTGEIIPNSLY